MEPNLSSDNDVQQDTAISDEDDFIIEEVESDLANQLIEKQVQVEPTKGMQFDSEDDAVSFYKSYAKKTGFGVIKRGCKRNEDGMVRYFTLACSIQGKAQYTSKNTFKPNPSIRMQCPAKVNFYLQGEKFCISSVILEHNHAVSPNKARFLRCHKKLDVHAKRRLELNDQAGIRINKSFGSLVVQAGGYENLEFGEKECRNYQSCYTSNSFGRPLSDLTELFDGVKQRTEPNENLSPVGWPNKKQHRPRSIVIVKARLSIRIIHIC
jgi:hypothetical protein